MACLRFVGMYFSEEFVFAYNIICIDKALYLR